MRSRLAAASVLVALLAVACYRGYAVEGRLLAADERRGVQCQVTVAEASHAEAGGQPCSSPEVPPLDATGPWIVLTGSQFRCVVSYATGMRYLRVRCPAYPPVDHPFDGCDADCDDVDLGVIVIPPVS